MWVVCLYIGRSRRQHRWRRRSGMCHAVCSIAQWDARWQVHGLHGGGRIEAVATMSLGGGIAVVAARLQRMPRVAIGLHRGRGDRSSRTRSQNGRHHKNTSRQNTWRDVRIVKCLTTFHNTDVECMHAYQHTYSTSASVKRPLTTYNGARTRALPRALYRVLK